MASAKELKDRIKAVEETKKITGAMHLISSTKLRRAKVELAQTRAYFDALRRAITDILCVPPEYESRYFRAGGAGTGACGVLVITADKGLAGAYNLNVLRAAEALCASIPDARLFVIGEYGHRYFTQHAPESTVYAGGAQTPTPERARSLGDDLLARYDAGELGELYVIYTDMKNGLASETHTHKLLPLPRGAAGDGGAPRAQTEFLPSVDEVVRTGVRSYLRGFVYCALLDSYCAEQNARVSAMDAANRNAQELLGDLSLQLNRQRQAAITREITEISAGAQAQKNAGKKKGGA